MKISGKSRTALLLIGLLVSSLLAACGADQNPTPAPTPEPVLVESKTDTILTDLLIRYRSNGLEAARQYAIETGMLDSEDRVRFGLKLNAKDNVPAVQAKLQNLGANSFTSYAENLNARVSLPLLVQRSKDDNFWDELASIKEVKEVKILVSPPTMQAGTTDLNNLKLTGADRWQQAGYLGKGVKIGIIDSGYAGYKNFLGKALPSAAQLTFKSYLTNGSEGTEAHGLAVAEVVHTVAPESQLYLAAIEDEVGFANAVDWLIANKVRIIQVSMAWGGLWPSDGSSLLSTKLQEAYNNGILPIVSVGNYGEAHYSARFNPDSNGFQRFSESGEVLKITPLAETTWVALRWEEKWDAPTSNLDLFVLDDAQQPKGSSRNIQGEGSKKPPVELVPFKATPNEPVYVQVRESGKAVSGVRFHLFAYNAKIEGSTAQESVAIPADAKGAIAVGAVSVKDNKLETYSSRGPTTDGREKPDVVAPGSIALQVLPKGLTFSGTSAAAPHVAGLAAVIIGAMPELKVDEISTYVKHNAVPLFGEMRNPAWGYGLSQFGTIEAFKSGKTEMLGVEITGPARHDDFSDNQNGLPDNVTAYYGKLPGGSNGYFVRVGTASELNWSVYANHTYDEFRAEFSAGFPGVESSTGFFYGLIFWQRSPNEYYMLCGSGNRFAVLQRDGNRWTELIPWQQDPTPGTGNSLLRYSLEATRGYLRIKVGSNTLQSVTLNISQIGGKLGFASGSFSGVATPPQELPLAMFSDLTITPLSSR